MNYREEKDFTKQYKQQHLDGVEALIAQRQRDLAAERRAYTQDLFRDTEKYRADFRKMLGWPLVEHKEAALPRATAEKLCEEEGYTLYRMQFEVLDGLVMSGLYFEAKGAEKRPLVLVQHGGLGTPELISGVYGSTANYNRMLERVVAHGVHAFAPQLLLWDQKAYGISFDRSNIDARLKRLGGSIAAVELYGLTRILDYFENKENVSTLGMVGMSYGGFYTLFLTALDTRIRSAVSCSFFNTRDQYPWCDWTWQRAAALFDDAEVACLVYPRRLTIEIGTEDELFCADHGVRSFEKVKELCRAAGVDTDWVEFHPFTGTHEFCCDDAPIAALVEHLREV